MNTSLNVSRKKKKGLTKEEEEELRKKQASLFQNDQSLSMYPPEMNRATSTPTFQAASLPMYQGQIYQPNESKFYDGSITQVLHNPAINPNFNQSQPLPQGSPMMQASAPQQSNDIEIAAKEEEDEEVIDTNTKGDGAHNAHAMQYRRGKDRFMNYFFKLNATSNILGFLILFLHKILYEAYLKTVRFKVVFRGLNDRHPSARCFSD